MLNVAYEGIGVDQALAGGDTLAVFTFGASPLGERDPRHVAVALPLLEAGDRVELWRTEGPMVTGEAEGFRFARSPRLTMAHLALDWRGCGGMREAATEIYARMQAFLAAGPHHCPLKIWNHVPGINEGADDAERYRRFCVGRAEALSPDPGDHAPMPAATAIGTPADEPALQLYLLAGPHPGVNVENPRQVNAWRYPRRYSPRSPLFSRGTIMTDHGMRQILISGTASVVGHETQHDTVGDQAVESLRNVVALLGEARRVTGTASAGSIEGAAKVYLRNPADLEAVRQTLDERLPEDLPRVYLHGDICRADLLVEMDGVVRL